MRRVLIIALAAVTALTAGAWSLASGGYRVSVLLPSATNIIEGSSVLVNGVRAGEVGEVSVRDGEAFIALDLDSEYSPLHDGAKVDVGWKALLGERQLNVTDGPGHNAEIPDNGLLRGRMRQPMEVDQILNALDDKTRARLSSLMRRLNGTVGGNERDLQATLRTSGPALSALGDVLRGIGSDGPAIKAMVSRLNGMVGTLAARDGQLRKVVDGLSRVSQETAGQREKLSQSLRRMPGTLDTATRTLGNVPGTVDKAAPLLDELRPATDRLPGVTRNLAPVLRDLRPMTHQLRPTLAAADTVLDHTPGLLDSARPTLTGTRSAIGSMLPAMRFLRPYTPELASFFTTWASAFSNYDDDGHYTRLSIQASALSPNVNPGMVPPGAQHRPYQFPGEAGKQPWTDAFGSGMK